jgi:uncharacterized membrane protein YbhN (UPF0104 family)
MPKKLNLNNKLGFIAKCCVSLGLLVYLVCLVDWGRAIETLGEAVRLPLFVAPFILLTGLGISSLRWCLILVDSEVNFSAWQAYRGYWLGLFYGIFLPGVLGGDAVRIGLCTQRTNCPVGTATASVLLERISGILALFGMAFVVYLVSPATLSSLLTAGDTRLIAALAVVGILGMAAVLLGRQVWMRWLPKEGANGVWAFVRSAMLTLGTLRGRTLVLVLMLSAMFQATNTVVTFLLAQATGLDLPLTVFFAIMPLVYLATVLPISLGGLGVREGTLVFLLARFGVATLDAVTLSFLIYLNRVVVGGLGGLVQLAETLSSRQTDRVMKDAGMVGTSSQEWSH